MVAACLAAVTLATLSLGASSYDSGLRSDRDEKEQEILAGLAGEPYDALASRWSIGREANLRGPGMADALGSRANLWAKLAAARAATQQALTQHGDATAAPLRALAAATGGERGAPDSAEATSSQPADVVDEPQGFLVVLLDTMLTLVRFCVAVASIGLLSRRRSLTRRQTNANARPRRWAQSLLLPVRFRWWLWRSPLRKRPEAPEEAPLGAESDSPASPAHGGLLLQHSDVEL